MTSFTISKPNLIFKQYLHLDSLKPSLELETNQYRRMNITKIKIKRVKQERDIQKDFRLRCRDVRLHRSPY